MNLSEEYSPASSCPVNRSEEYSPASSCPALPALCLRCGKCSKWVYCFGSVVPHSLGHLNRWCAVGWHCLGRLRWYALLEAVRHWEQALIVPNGPHYFQCALCFTVMVQDVSPWFPASNLCSTVVDPHLQELYA